MKRRSFLKGLCVVPAIGLAPSLGFAEENFANITPPTSSGLDKIITIIQEDTRLNRKVDAANIAEALASAKKMNKILLEAIIQTGVANDKKISTADSRELNDYIFHNYTTQWLELHGDDADDEETGFHKVVNDGARTKLFGKNAINKIFDSIYHLGFDSHLKNRLLNEDGNKNTSYKNVAIWLDTLLKEDLESGVLENPDIKELVAETETGLDRVVEIIYNDEGLNRRISIGDMRVGAKSANEMNKLIIESIEATNAGSSGAFTVQNVKDMNSFLVENYADTWAQLHGDDEEEGEETGYHKVQNDGAKTKLFGKNAINRVFDGIYHLGFATPYKNRLVNEDGNKNARFKKVAQWLNQLMSDDLDNQKEDLNILIPLYSYPNWYDSENYVWQKMLDMQSKYPNAQIVAIVNPNNGEFRDKNSDYTKGIQDLIAANIKVVGYVYTQYANRATQNVVEDIDAWSRFYKEEGVSGIFFDEVSTSSNDLAHYTNLSSEARARGLEFVILNPGITTDQAYIDSGIANVVVSYENPNRGLLENPPATYNTPTKSTELSLLIYEMEDDTVDDLIAFAREHTFSYIYFTEDGFDGNPWDSVSVYFEDQISKMMV
ncbi:spherulation-specific family 4 protein [bacterium]|nr:spherulation-specific family 4 protein [bacterium]MBU1957345.1 spherulation-specific family 4 protein [bacterium]